MPADPLPPKLQRIVDLFATAPKQVKLQALLDYSDRLPPLPDHLAGHEEAMERVHECVSPFFLATELGDDGTVRLYFDAPPEAPTTRGYAGIIADGLDGLPAADILGVPETFYVDLGLAEVVSAQRLHGMAAILARVKRQIREAQAA